MPTAVTAAAVEHFVFDALRQLGADPANISREATLEALEVDSLDLAELSQMIDETFGIELKADDIAGIQTVADAVDLVVARGT